MRTGSAKLALLLLCGTLLSAPALLAKKKQNAKSGPAEHKRAVHALNRLTFGPRPGDVQQVMAIGVEKWIDLQLHPEKINDGSIESRLASFRTLHLSARDLASTFPDNQLIRDVIDGNRSMPSDPASRAIFQVQIARLQARKERKAEAANSASAAPPPSKNDPLPEGSASPESSAPVSSSGSMAENGSMAGPEGAPEANTDHSAMSPAHPAEDSTTPNPAPGAESRTSTAGLKPSRAEDPGARRREERLYADVAVQQLLSFPPNQRFEKVLAMPVDELVALADSLRGNGLQEFVAGMDPKQRETILALNNPQGVVTDELAQAKLLRAIYSERQLEEVMTDFWFNHFNVYMGKGADRILLTSYEQDAIRPRALGKFEDLLVATAKSPAMLFYLDNWLSVGPNAGQMVARPMRPMRPRGPYGRYPRRVPPRNTKPKRKQNSGLNENYGRELLELHTLSVNGGYSQRDVTEVAKVFTGWTIDKPYEGGGFRFDPLTHEPGPKFVLGHRIKPKGEDEGREVLHRLATSQQTAHFISLKLAERFVSDEPPAALVDRLAEVFLKKKGDIREVLSALFHSPEFWAEDTYRAKVKTPLEFVASAARSTGADVEDAAPLVRQLSDMGMPLYGAQPPTGYSMKADTWVSSSALLNRLNFAVSLAAGRVRGVKVDVGQIAGGSPAPADSAMTISAMETGLLGGDVSKQTHDSIVAQIDDAGKTGQRKPDARSPDAGTIAGLLLGSPEFQRR